MDIDQSARRKAQEYFGIKDPDYYEYEGHIFFDDAMEENDDGEMVPNRFVEILVSVMDQAATYGPFICFLLPVHINIYDFVNF